MNELEIVRDLFAEPAPPDARVVVQARRHATGSARRRRSRWIVPGLGLAGATAAAATTLTLAAVIHPGGNSGPSPSAVPMSAKQVLLMAAASSAKAPVRSGTYWFTHFQDGQSLAVPGKDGTYVVVTRSEEKDWTNAHSPRRTAAEIMAGRGGSTTHYWALRRLGAHPARPSDVAAWKRAGSPSDYPVLDGRKIVDRQSSAATPWRTYKEETAFESAFADGSLQDLRKLPTDPAELRRYFLTHTDSSQGGRQSWQSDTEWLCDAAGRLLAFEPVTPQVREAAYRMLAELPDVHIVGRVQDPLGRPGVAVGVRGTGDMEDRLVVDPSTGRLLTQESVSLRGHSVPPGTIMIWNALVDAAWTDRAPGNATTPGG